jgi:hypothetical protein
MRTLLFVSGALWLWAAPLQAADIGIQGRKLEIVDEMVSDSDAHFDYRSRYHSPVSKGSGTDVMAISAQFDVSYVNGATSGSFVMPAGGIGWIVNKTRVAKYVNPQSPIGGGTRVGLIKPGGRLSMTARSLGDVPIDILGAGHPGPSGVLTVFTVTNGIETNRHCTLFTECNWFLRFQNTGAELDCRNGTAAACP